MPFIARGSFVALVTPFDARGRIDRTSLENLVAWHIEQGTDGLVCCGATGEGMTLSPDERKKVTAICLSVAAKKIPILVNSGTADTKQSVRLTEQMLSLGADGCLITTPYYNKPTQKGCIRHFAEIARVGLPVIVYNNPARTLKLDATTVAECASIPGIVGYKDSTNDIAFVRSVRKLCSIPIFSGDDALTFATLQEGGVGAISVIGNIFPKQWKKMICSALAKNWDKSFFLFTKYLPLCNALFLEVNPQCVKFAMKCLHLCQEHLRLPLLLPEPTTQKQIQKTLLQYVLPYAAQNIATRSSKEENNNNASGKEDMFVTVKDTPSATVTQ